MSRRSKTILIVLPAVVGVLVVGACASMFRPARQALEGTQKRLDFREGEVHETSRDLSHGRERGWPYPYTPVAA
jgi:hypothetical protein